MLNQNHSNRGGSSYSHGYRTAAPQPDDEGVLNAQAFIDVFTNASPEVKGKVCMYPGADSLHLSNQLARGSDKVILVNAANNK